MKQHMEKVIKNVIDEISKETSSSQNMIRDKLRIIINEMNSIDERELTNWIINKVDDDYYYSNVSIDNVLRVLLWKEYLGIKGEFCLEVIIEFLNKEFAQDAISKLLCLEDFCTQYTKDNYIFLTMRTRNEKDSKNKIKSILENNYKDMYKIIFRHKVLKHTLYQ